jgi:hypothetical protein
LGLHFLSSPCWAQTSVLTYHYDNLRTGQNTNETILTPASVASNFGGLFSQPVDGQIYAQPLYVPNVAIPGRGTHNVVFVNTENDSVFAFDADSNAGSNSAPLWQVSLIDAAHGAPAGATPVPAGVFPVNSSGSPDCGDISPILGSTSTPVIDPSTGTIYVEAFSYENGVYVHRLHALDITTGAEEAFGPATVAATVSGTGDGSSTVAFNAYNEQNRPAVTLANGIVYLAFAASCADEVPFHGWVFAYDAGTLNQQGVFLTTPNGTFGGIWMTGDGLAVDASGNIYMSTGNGDFDTLNIPATDVGDSVLKLTLNNGGLNLADYFTPYDQETLSDEDADLASGGILLLPDQPGPFPHEMVAAGKGGRIYLINRGQFTIANQHYCANCSSDPQIVQESASGYLNVVFSTPAYWNSTLYYWTPNLYLKAIPIANGLLNFDSYSQTQDTYGFPGANLSVSANGNSNGILWALKTDAFKTGGAVVLRAYNATNVSNRLYSSDLNPNDAAGPAVKFTVPMVANGKVYVGSADRLTVYGLSNGTPTPISGPTAISSSTPTATPTVTAATTATPTQPAVATATPTTAATATPTATVTATATATGTPTSTATPFPSNGVIRHGTSEGGAVGFSPTTINLYATTANDDLVMVCFCAGNDPLIFTPPGGYTQLGSNQEIGISTNCGLFYHIWQTGDTLAPSFVDTAGDNEHFYIATSYSGENTSSPFDPNATPSQNGNSSDSITLSAVSPAGASDMLTFCGFEETFGGGSYTPTYTSPLTQFDSEQIGGSWLEMFEADASLTSSGSTGGMEMTTAGADDTGGFMIAIQPVTATTPTTPIATVPAVTPTLTAAATPTPPPTAAATSTPSATPAPTPTPIPTGGKLSLSTHSLSFGAVKTGKHPKLSFTIKNGAKTMLYGQVDGSALASPLSVKVGMGAFAVGRNQTHRVTVEAAPTEVGKFSGTITIHSGDPRHLVISVAAKGRGIQ